MIVLGALGVLAGALLLGLIIVTASPDTSCNCGRRRGPGCPRCYGTGRRFRFGARATRALVVTVIVRRRTR